MSQKIADGFGDLGDLLDTHHALIQNGKLTLIGQKFVPQPTFNYGHRVAIAGTYVLTLDEKTGKWERHDFPALISEENSEELLFVRDGQLYLLAYNNFAVLGFQKLFKWVNNKFEEITLKAPEPRNLTEGFRVNGLAAAGTTSNGSTILFLTDDDGVIQLYSLAVDGNLATIENTTSIPVEQNPLRGQPTIAEVNGNKVLVSYGVHGCGFRWERSRFLVVDLESKFVRNIELEGEYSEQPKFCFSGPKTSYLSNDGKKWIVAVGSLQQGMTGSSFYGAAWALKGNVFDENAKLQWVELPQTVEKGEHILDGHTLYTITKEETSKVQLGEN